MLFNSIPFLVFFSAFFLFYWFVFQRSLKIQNLFLLAGSYFFYAWWDWRFLFLLAGNSLLSYFLGILIYESQCPKRRSFFVFLGLLQSLGVLVLFKYFDFFIASVSRLLDLFGFEFYPGTLNLILPLGISFYTFRTISYLLDINNGKVQPVRDWCIFLNYISFFPSLISGPIDRTNLLVPQLGSKRSFTYESGVDGMRQILWGLFKKIVIADNCAEITGDIFSNYEALPGSTLFIGSIFYTIQIYADFSGYSDMAIGISRLLGFNITKNFDFPFFAQNIAEFWRKWHISLTSWLTDYVFTPLSIVFRDYGKTGLIMAILVNFTLIGIWHGANWTFILFGFLHGCYFIPLIISGSLNKRRKKGKHDTFPALNEWGAMLGTFLLVTLTFVLFRSESPAMALGYYKKILSPGIFSAPVFNSRTNVAVLCFFCACLLIAEWKQRYKDHGLQFSKNGETESARSLSVALRWLTYMAILCSILVFKNDPRNFIYFNF